MQSTLRFVVAAVTMALVTGTVAFAQTAPTGSIRGHVKDEQSGAVPDVTLRASSPDAPGVYNSASDAEGYYRLLDLPPGTYTITAERPGFTKFVRENVSVRAGLNLALDIMLKVGDLQETVTVRLDTPMLESTKPVTAFNVSGELQRNLPISSKRAWADALFLVPGTVRLENAGTQTGVFTVHGATNASNVMQIDGVNVDAVNQSSFSHAALNVDAITDVQVKTAATDAATPLGWGAVLGVVTKSGTNELAGSATMAVQPKAWLGNNAPAGTTGGVEVIQPDFAAGGPIRRDRTCFFGAFRYTYNARLVDRTPTQLATLQALVPAFEAFGGEARAPLYFGKVTAALWPGHRVFVSYLYDRFPNDAPTFLDAGPFIGTVIGGPALTTRLTSVWTRKLFTEITVARDVKAQSNLLRDLSSPARRVHRQTSLSGGRLVGTGTIAHLDNFPVGSSVADAAKTTVMAGATYYHKGLLGSHEVQFGVHLQPVMRQDVVTKYPSNGFAIEDVVLRNAADPAAGFIPFHRQIYDSAEFMSSSQRRSDNALYVQDVWRPVEQFAISVGVRVDFVRRTDRLLDLETENSTNVGPRLGANYAFGAGTNSLRAHWGRVHELLSRQSLTAGTTTLGFRDLYDLNLDGTFETTFVQPGATVRSPNRIFDAGYHQPFLDEWGAGYRRQLPGETTVDFSVLRRAFKDRDTTIEVNAIYEDRVFKGYRDVSQSMVFHVTNDVWTTPIYTALELTVAKQSRWLQLLAAYTRQWHRLDDTWRPNDVASIIQPDAFSNEKGIEFAAPSDSYAGATVINDAGRDHLVRVSANVTPFWRLSFATAYSYQSGQWSGPITKLIAARDPAFGPSTVTLSNGRVVSNPLATTTRFAFPTRAEGQFRLDGVHTVNLRIARDFRLSQYGLKAALDVFNVGNLGGFQALASNAMSNPSYGTGVSRQLPRSVEVSVGLVF